MTRVSVETSTEPMGRERIHAPTIASERGVTAGAARPMRSIFEAGRDSAHLAKAAFRTLASKLVCKPPATTGPTQAQPLDPNRRSATTRWSGTAATSWPPCSRAKLLSSSPHSVTPPDHVEPRAERQTQPSGELRTSSSQRCLAMLRRSIAFIFAKRLMNRPWLQMLRHDLGRCRLVYHRPLRSLRDVSLIHRDPRRAR